HLWTTLPIGSAHIARSNVQISVEAIGLGQQGHRSPGDFSPDIALPQLETDRSGLAYPVTPLIRPELIASSRRSQGTL
ncbi:MAG: hypothetical protein VYB46_07560, partial [Pseudomonadota bacterium]|nr:hypothetical protein [Pseudomonadota bacterium]